MDGDLIALVNKLQYVDAGTFHFRTMLMEFSLEFIRDTFNAIGGDAVDL